jgi:hypothetical protein
VSPQLGPAPGTPPAGIPLRRKAPSADDLLGADPYVRVVGPSVRDTVLTALEAAGSRTTGPDRAGEYSSLCPAHKDSSASLRWRVSRDGRALLFCHAGCEMAAILEALGLDPYRVYPVRVEYDYHSADGAYAFSVVRGFAADGTKTFHQGIRDEAGQVVPGRGDVPDVLWRAPELAAWKGETLYLLEGERDALVLGWALAWAERSDAFATTGPGGAGRWSPELDEGVMAAVAGGVRRIVVVADRDGAGVKRGRGLAVSLQDLVGDDVAVVAMIPIDGAGKDLAAVIDRWGPGAWEGRLEALDSDAFEAWSDREGTAVTAGLTRWIDPETGSVVLGLSGDRGTRTAIAAGIEVTAWWGTPEVAVGWEIEITDPVTGKKRRAVVGERDLVSQEGFRRWMYATGLTRATVSIGELADRLPGWLRYETHVKAVPRSVAAAVTGWVDASSGKAAATAAPEMIWVDDLGRALITVGASGETEPGGASGVRYTGRDVVHARWGTAGDDRAARWAFARALTYADAHTVAAVAGWVGATVLGPWLASAGVPIRPGLAVISPSGSGKTSGAAGLLLALGGCTGPITSTRAAFRRLLQGGVGVIRWLDDSDLADDPGFKELLRVATTRSDHVLSDPDSGASATEGAMLTSSIVISAEGVSWLTETAMADRFAVVSPDNPQGRKSMLKGRGAISQWDDVTGLVREIGDGEGGAGSLANLAGWTVRGIVGAAIAAGDGDATRGVMKWLDAAGGTGNRRQATHAALAAGTRAIVAWLSDGADADDAAGGAGWPGNAHGGLHDDWAWLGAALASWTSDGAHETQPVACSLIDTVIPALLRADRLETSAAGRTAYLISGVDASGPGPWRDTVTDPRTLGGAAGAGIEAAAVPILLDADGRYWVAPSLVAECYDRVTRGRRESRLSDEHTMRLQTVRLADDPEWATFGGGDRPKLGWRIRRGADRITYRRLSELASARISMHLQ